MDDERTYYIEFVEVAVLSLLSEKFTLKVSKHINKIGVIYLFSYTMPDTSTMSYNIFNCQK